MMLLSNAEVKARKRTEPPTRHAAAEALARGAVHGVDMGWQPLQTWLETIVGSLVENLVPPPDVPAEAGEGMLLHPTLRRQLVQVEDSRDEHTREAVGAAVRLTMRVSDLLDRAARNWSPDQLEAGLRDVVADYLEKYVPQPA